MSSSDSCSSEDDWPWDCHCNHSDDSESCTSEDYDSESDEPIDNDTQVKERKKVFISVYKHEGCRSLNVISDSMEIANYNEKYKQLPKKNSENVNNIWGNVKVTIPVLGHVTLKLYEEQDLNLNSRSKILQKTTDNSAPADPKVITPEISDKIPSSDKIPLKNKSGSKVPSTNNEDTNNNGIGINIKNQEDKNRSQDKNQNDITVSKSTNDLNKNKTITPKKQSNSTTAAQIDVIKTPCGSEKDSKNTASEGMRNSIITPKKSVQDQVSKKKLKKQKQKEKKSAEFESSDINKILEFIEPEQNTKSKSKASKANAASLKLPCKDRKISITEEETKANKNEDKKVSPKVASPNEKGGENDKIKVSNSLAGGPNQASASAKKRKEKAKSNVEKDDGEYDLLSDMEHIPSFVTASLKNKKIEVPKTVESKSIPKKTSSKLNELEFILNNKKRGKTNLVDNNYMQYSEKFGEEAGEMMMGNNLMGALEYLIEALSFNPTDHRHYLNRCYCYLRMGRYALASTDAEYVIRVSSNVGHLFIANLRAGQASLALKNFRTAEKYLKEATEINPENHFARRELLKAKIEHLVSMGFDRKDAILALEMTSDTMQAMKYLKQNKRNINDPQSRNNSTEFLADPFDDIIYSSDEDDQPNNVEIINTICKYKPGKTKLIHIISKPSNTNLHHPHAPDKFTNAKVAVKNPDTVLANNYRAVWVGNITNKITEAMLKKKFKEYGRVVSVYRPTSEAYCFVNFERCEDAAKVLAGSHVDLDGKLLPVRPGKN